MIEEKYVIGIDEVGRGCLAGPVHVVAVAIPVRFRPIKGKGRVTLKDSKKLNVHQRQVWFDYLKSQDSILYSVASVEPKVIDRINIARAANLAAFRAFSRLTTSYQLKETNYRLFLDGGLYLRKKKFQLKHYPKAQTLIRADEHILAVKIASVLAKGHRDQRMIRLAKRYPEYGFEIHKGYATKFHRGALLKLGPTPLHRVSFIS